ncbi:CmcI family methyltransferase [Caenimonas soli]|uniref:CmcI family methyltransferase n=1 Tax=Caenimonas soli TaxID=2735555 RepID=UPI0015573B11|nr:CmcI family methyltransferase [Caenimonas soli]NPC57187.1 methyltransferase domain-containing protein [Caenimonas soli]
MTTLLESCKETLQAAPRHCSFCSSPVLFPFLFLPDRDGGPTRVWQCYRCGSLVPDHATSGTSAANEVQIQVDFHENFFGNDGPESLDRLHDDLFEMVGSLEPHLGFAKDGNVLIELGCGRGGLLSALRTRGYRAIGCEPSARLVAMARQHYGLGHHLQHATAEEFLEERARRRGEKAAAVLMWHVLEHVRSPLRLIESTLEVLKDDGRLILQLPLLHREFVYREHLFFPSRASVKYIEMRLGLFLVQQTVDHRNRFVTLVFGRSAQGHAHPAYEVDLLDLAAARAEPMLVREDYIALLERDVASLRQGVSRKQIEQRVELLATADEILDVFSDSFGRSKKSPEKPNHSPPEPLVTSTTFLTNSTSAQDQAMPEPREGDIRRLLEFQQALSSNALFRKLQSVGLMPKISAPPDSDRSTAFSRREGNRYWWHRVPGNDYVPPVYAGLRHEEWALLKKWFDDGDAHFSGTGECNVPSMSLLHGLIGGNGMSRVVQCGHYIGYSTLLLGFLLRSMGRRQALYSVDIDPAATRYTNTWVKKAQLQDVVRLSVRNSADPEAVAEAQRYLGGAAQIVFIDSSHQYAHTLEELDAWFPALCEGGFLILHDTSAYAATFDPKGGGVGKAVTEWCERKGLRSMALNGFVDGGTPGDYPYLDGCGLTLIQKPKTI